MKSLSPKSIWNYPQNKPTLVAKDLEDLGIPRDKTYRILLIRGVFKWLAARRDIIKLKNIWRDRITATIQEIREAKARNEGHAVQRLRGRLEALNECRKEVRKICHSDRWRAPDFDKQARNWLERQ